MVYWAWLALGLALAAVEMVTQTFVLIWFGIAAVIVGLTVWAMPGFNGEAEFVAFGVLSMLLLVPAWIIRARLRQRRRETNPDLINDRAGQHVGRTLVLTEPIDHGRGRAFIGDTLWQLQGPDLAVGQAVRVIGTDGMTLRVVAATAA